MFPFSMDFANEFATTQTSMPGVRQDCGMRETKQGWQFPVASSGPVKARRDGYWDFQPPFIYPFKMADGLFFMAAPLWRSLSPMAIYDAFRVPHPPWFFAKVGP